MGIPILDEKCDLSIIVDMTGVTAYCTTRTFYISAGGVINFIKIYYKRIECKYCIV